MMISWGNPSSPKYLTIQWCEWDKGEYKFLNFSRVPLGWSANISRLSVCYDDYTKVKQGED